MYHPLVAIVGRANVGKSTLFNRLVSAPLAITDAQAGTTRDTNITHLEWRGRDFWLADSAGLEAVTEHSSLKQSIAAQHKKLMAEAQVLLWLIDGQVNLTPTDRRIARLLKPHWSKVRLVVNKVDNPTIRRKFSGQKILGLPTSLVSGKNGAGAGDLLDDIINTLNTSATVPAAISIVLAGKPNVGKSSLVNAILGEDRSLVDATPHTTRDSQRSWVTRQQVSWCLVDTAGIRRQAGAASAVESKSVRQTLDNLNKGQVIFLVLDAGSNFTWQDQRLGELVEAAGKPAIILLNKIDLVTKTALTDKKLSDQISRWLPMLGWAKIKFVSALKPEGLNAILAEAQELYELWQYKISEAQEEKIWNRLPKSFGSNQIRLVKFSQTRTAPPGFDVVLGTRLPIPEALRHIIVKIIRRELPILKHTPLRVALRRKSGV